MERPSKKLKKVPSKSLKKAPSKQSKKTADGGKNTQKPKAAPRRKVSSGKTINPKTKRVNAPTGAESKGRYFEDLGSRIAKRAYELYVQPKSRLRDESSTFSLRSGQRHSPTGGRPAGEAHRRDLIGRPVRSTYRIQDGGALQFEGTVHLAGTRAAVGVAFPPNAERKPQCTLPEVEAGTPPNSFPGGQGCKVSLTR